jgi:hypothetical protein
MHNWSLALDLDSRRNDMDTPAPFARFSTRRYKPVIDIFEYHGLKSLGKHMNYDWMHFQFTTWNDADSDGSKVPYEEESQTS